MNSRLQAKLRLLFCVLFSLTASGFVPAQAKWHIFSPPDKSFTVELPENAKPVAPQKDEISFESLFDNVRSGYAYNFGLRRNDPLPGFLFGVVHLTRPTSNHQFDETVNSNMLWIGGDDKHFSKEANVIVSGFHGRDFIFEKGDASGRALFLNSGTRIFFLFFLTEDKGVVLSESVARVFRTFRPARRVTNPTKR